MSIALSDLIFESLKARLVEMEFETTIAISDMNKIFLNIKKSEYMLYCEKNESANVEKNYHFKLFFI